MDHWSLRLGVPSAPRHNGTVLTHLLTVKLEPVTCEVQRVFAVSRSGRERELDVPTQHLRPLQEEVDWLLTRRF